MAPVPVARLASTAHTLDHRQATHHPKSCSTRRIPRTSGSNFLLPGAPAFSITYRSLKACCPDVTIFFSAGMLTRQSAMFERRPELRVAVSIHACFRYGRLVFVRKIGHRRRVGQRPSLAPSSGSLNRRYWLMSKVTDPGLLFLHALPLDGSMWAAQMNLLPGSSYAPTLYGFGDTVEEWTMEALKRARNDRLIVVGCSIGGSCALEVTTAAPERVAALVLIGTKAEHNPDPDLHASALELIEKEGVNRAWERYWAPLFSKSADPKVVEAAQSAALRRPSDDIARGVTAFHSRRSRHQVVSDCQSPVIVITGEDDAAPGLEASAELAASAKRGSLHVIPSCGHYVPLEQPDALSAILIDVIKAQT